MTHRIGFILLPGYSMLSFASAVEPLNICNDITGQKMYEHFTVGLKQSTTSGLGNEVETDHTLTEIPEADALIVVGSSAQKTFKTSFLEMVLRSKAPTQALGGIASGSYVLAKAGLLNGYQGVVHHNDPVSLFKEHKAVQLSTESFCIDRDRLTCRGGSTSLDMMLMWIAKTAGVDVAEKVSDHFIHERFGTPMTESPISVHKESLFNQPKLVEAIELMENNIEEPLTTEDISSYLDISRRQLERLFKKHLSALPGRYYLSIRLKEAHRRLTNSKDGISDIASRCGFSSGAHFSTVYRTHYGLTPSEGRFLFLKMGVEERAL